MRSRSQTKQLPTLPTLESLAHGRFLPVSSFPGVFVDIDGTQSHGNRPSCQLQSPKYFDVVSSRAELTRLPACRSCRSSESPSWEPTREHERQPGHRVDGNDDQRAEGSEEVLLVMRNVFW